MCLDISENVETRLRKRFARACNKGRNQIKLWKVWEWDGVYRGKLRNKYRPAAPSPKTGGRWTSTRRTVSLLHIEQSDQKVRKGIHVFIRKDDAIRAAGYYGIVVPIYTEESDLVAAGRFGQSESAVFIMVEIRRTDWNRAIRQSTYAYDHKCR